MVYNHDSLTDLILGLEKVLGRLPTEEEVYDFLTGDSKKRQDILNSASNDPTN